MRIHGALLGILAACIASHAWGAPKSLTYQGRIVKSDGRPLEYNNVSFHFEITSPDGLCVLYREQVNGINMENSKGVFDITIGEGTQSFPGNGIFTLPDSFNNSTTLTCDGGVPYSPAYDEGRKLRVKFHDGTGWKTISPDTIIRSVPYASYATSATKLGDHAVTDFVLKTGLPVCGAGTFLSWNGSALSCVAVSGASGGTVTEVTSANSYLTVTNTTSTPEITLNVGTSSNTVAAGNDARFTNARTPTGAASGDLSGTYPAPTVAKIQGQDVSANIPVAGQFFKFSAAQWIPTNIATGDVTGLNALLASYVTQTYFNSTIASANCAQHQTMYWSSATSTFLCQNINVGLGGDASGSIASVSVDKIKGVGVDFSVAPTSGQFLKFNGTSWIAASDNNAGGTITALTGDVSASGSGSVASTVNSVGGSSAANIRSAELLANAATNANTASAIMKRDSSGNFAASDATLSKVLLKDSGSNTVSFSAPATVTTSYVLKMPVAQGANNQVLTNDGSGNLFWSVPAGTGVNSVAVTAPITNSGTSTAPNIGIPAATTSVNGYLSSTDWNTFNSKLGTATTFSGDISGNYNSTSVNKIKGVGIDFTVAPTSGQFLKFNGTNWIAASDNNSGGTITALTGDVSASGSGSVASTVNSVGGSSAANIRAAELLANAATSVNTASTIVKRDASGNFAASDITLSKGVFKDSGTNTVTLSAPAAVTTSYALKMPPAQGANNQVLMNDGSGNLSWAIPAGTGVSSLAVTAPITNSGTATAPNIGIPAATTSVNGYLTSTDWNTFNNKLGTATAFSGDISGAYNSTSVDKIKGRAVSATAPTTGQFLVYNGTTQYVPVSMSGDATMSSTGALTIANGAVTNADLANMAANTLKGNITGAAAAPTDVTIASLQGTSATTFAAGNDTRITGALQTSGGTLTGMLTLATGTTTLSPLRIPAGTLVTTPVSGNIESDGTNLYWTNSTPTRQKIGTVTAVSSANTDIGVATGTTTPVLTLNSGTSGGAGDANKIAKLDASGLLAAGMLPSHDAGKITTGTLPIARGGTNSATALSNNRIMASTGGAIVEAAAITASRALISDTNGIPTHSAVTNTELGYLSGVTSAVQTQINNKASSGGWTNYSAMGVNGSGALTAIPGATSGSHLNWTVTGPAWTTAAFPNTTTANQLLYSSANNVVGGLATVASAVLTTNGSGVPSWGAISSDVFTQYAILAGRAGGQTLNGGTAASNNLTLDSTAHATKGNILLNPTGGSVGVGTATTATTAALDVTSTTKGFLPPRMTTAQRDAIASPAEGLVVFNTSTDNLEVFNGTTWSSASGSGTQEVAQGSAVTLTSIYADIITLTTASAGKYLILASGSNTTTNPWTYFSTGCRLTRNGSIIDSKFFYYGATSGGSGPSMPMFHYSLQTLSTNDVLKIQCNATSDNSAMTANSWKISLLGLGISNISGADDLGNHTATMNLNLGAYKLVGNGGTAGISILNNGYTGVGTTAPNRHLVVVDQTGGGARGISSRTYSPNTGGVMEVAGSGGTLAAPIALKTGNVLGYYSFSGFDGSDVTIQSNPTGMSAFASENWTPTTRGSAINFSTTPVGTATAVERMRIEQNGFVGVGGYPSFPFQVLHPPAPNDVNTNIVGVSLGADATLGPLNLFIWGRPSATATNRFMSISAGDYLAARDLILNVNSNGAAGKVGIGTTTPGYSLHVVGTAGLSSGTAWTAASDARLKDIHGEYEYGLNEILKLHTVRFNYKKGNPLKLPSDKPMTGFIAQEVQKVIPDAVNTRKDGYLELNVDPIHWATVNAVQELYQMCKPAAALEQENMKLKSRVEKLEADNELMKASLCQKDPSYAFCK